LPTALLLTAVSVLTWFLTAVDQLDAGHREEGAQQLEAAVRRAAAACYAQEGVYPPSLAYLQEHYGIQVGAGYTVVYTPVASNLMPEITVLELMTNE